MTRGTLVDVGCGSGRLWHYVGQNVLRYVGIDAVKYDGFPDTAEFIQANLDHGPWPLAESAADVATAVEVIEHLENPRAFMRQLVSLTKPGGLVIVTTPNQLSFLSLTTLIFKQRFSAFQDVHYPAHLTALLEIDLIRIASECGLANLRIIYSCQGRIIISPWHYPSVVSRLLPRRLSDNLMLIGTRS